MKGTMLTFTPGIDLPTVKKYDQVPPLTDLQEAIGGYLESVPYFNWIWYEDDVIKCIAYCNEYGKLKQMEINKSATYVWYSLPNQGHLTRDVLVGSVIVLFGDSEFMEGM